MVGADEVGIAVADLGELGLRVRCADALGERAAGIRVVPEAAWHAHPVGAREQGVEPGVELRLSDVELVQLRVLQAGEVLLWPERPVVVDALRFEQACSRESATAIAAGTSRSLVERAADVGKGELVAQDRAPARWRR